MSLLEGDGQLATKSEHGLLGRVSANGIENFGKRFRKLEIPK